MFLPDRLELIKGAPVAAPRPPGPVRGRPVAGPGRHPPGLRPDAGPAQRSDRPDPQRAPAAVSRWRSWDLAAGAARDRADGRPRASAVEAVAGPFARCCAELGLDGEPALAYRPRSRARDAEQLRRRARASGSTAISSAASPATGPTATTWSTQREGRELRAYGSQGQQRLALLALLLAEREALAARREAPPVMLLDDVMSELDHDRRRALVELLRATGGQSVITATDLDQIPGAEEPGVTRLAVSVDGECAGRARRRRMTLRGVRRDLPPLAPPDDGALGALPTTGSRRRCWRTSSARGPARSARRSPPRRQPTAERGGVVTSPARPRCGPRSSI